MKPKKCIAKPKETTSDTNTKLAIKSKLELFYHTIFCTKNFLHNILNDNAFAYSRIYLFQKNQKKLCGIKKI
jgi:hypothetical protein